MATSTIKKQLKLQTYEGIATTDGTGDFIIPSGIVNPNNGAIVAIRGIRDSSGYSGWHGFLYGSPITDTFGFKALADNNTALGNANVHYRIYYILFN